MCSTHPEKFLIGLSEHLFDLLFFREIKHLREISSLKDRVSIQSSNPSILECTCPQNILSQNRSYIYIVLSQDRSYLHITVLSRDRSYIHITYLKGL